VPFVPAAIAREPTNQPLQSDFVKNVARFGRGSDIMKAFIVIVLCVSTTVRVEPQSQPVDLKNEQAELLRLHTTDREAHFKTDVSLLQQSASDEFISVSNGAVARISKEQERTFFEAYFKGATYSEWDDLEPPIVRVSKDGSMAWMITRVRVTRAEKNSDGVARTTTFVYAGVMTYEKRAGKWFRVANVSTFEPQGERRQERR
jgi:hypothetical protein